MKALLSRLGIEGSWFKPAFWLYLSPLIWPLYLVKFELKSIPFNVLEVVVLTLFFWQMLIWMAGLWRDRKQFKIKLRKFGQDNKWFVWLSLLFLTCGVIGVLIVPESTLQ
ncbi:hypothetical protein IT411_00580, partial [Candidatus Peregrinibacteria bacterium]|nr:hypothetical protein [Candidatus Peregrinibacteria bacterium]